MNLNAGRIEMCIKQFHPSSAADITIDERFLWFLCRWFCHIFLWVGRTFRSCS